MTIGRPTCNKAMKTFESNVFSEKLFINTSENLQPGLQ